MKTQQKHDWLDSLKPLFKLYGTRKHPLEHKNRYQLLVMVVLSARSSDKQINAIAPAFFQHYPTLKSLSTANAEDVFPYFKTSNFVNKTNWLIEIAKILGKDENIPHTLRELTALPGIGRKSANVIMSESGDKPEGVIVDLHTMRVSPRIGIAKGTNPENIEKQLMEKIPQKYWKQLGMSLTFLGRELCRPKNPKCIECPLNNVCEYFAESK